MIKIKNMEVRKECNLNDDEISRIENRMKALVGSLNDIIEKYGFESNTVREGKAEIHGMQLICIEVGIYFDVDYGI